MICTALYLGADGADHGDGDIELEHRGRGEVLDKEVSRHQLDAAQVTLFGGPRLVEGEVKRRHSLDKQEVVLNAVRLLWVGGRGNISKRGTC
jgi:hypothetical protein